MNFHRFIFSFVLISLVQFAPAQNGSTLKASVDKRKILIGERIQLTLEANYPDNAEIKFITIDSLEHFEILGDEKIDTINTAGGTVIKGVYQITSFDSGSWVIPSFSILPAIRTDSIPIEVIFSDFDPNKDYHDVKDIIEVNIEEKTPWWWYAAGGFLALLIILFILFRKKKPKSSKRAIPTIDPYDEAMKELALLQKQMPETKLFHTRLTDIFRLYIYRRKEILSLQKTTDDLVIQVKNLGLNKEIFDNLSQTLRLSDFVKFAKYIPVQEDNIRAFDSIKKAIEGIEKLN